MEYLFPALHFQSVCVPCFEVGLFQITYIGVLFLYPARLCLLVGAFNPFTFKVLIDKYDGVAIYCFGFKFIHAFCVSFLEKIL